MIKEENEMATLYRWPALSLKGLNLTALTGSDDLLYWRNKEGHTYIGIGKAKYRDPDQLPLFHKTTFEGVSEQRACAITFRLKDGNFTAFVAKGANPHDYLNQELALFCEEQLFRRHREEKNQLGHWQLSELIPHQKEWERRVKESLQRPDITKSVLSRKFIYEKKPLQHYSSSSDTSPQGGWPLFIGLKNYQAETLYHCFFDDFMSFTPESLITKKGDICYLEAIAGTHPNNGQEEDLLHDLKEIHEHREVILGIEELARPLGQLQKGETGLLKLKTLSHLRTPLELTLHKESTREELVKLVMALHPTAAVGGSPKKTALEFIKECEGERGPYAGFFGPEDGDYLELCVLIRSLKVRDQQLEAYAGAGIVEGSDPLKEWDETLNKIKSFLPTPSFNHQQNEEKKSE